MKINNIIQVLESIKNKKQIEIREFDEWKIFESPYKTVEKTCEYVLSEIVVYGYEFRIVKNKIIDNKKK